ncbi:hypothetical protein [Pseudomonas sp. URMO17WK12:I11]|uniref:hypothetical protein n=1 Tax=Pseudomonas sp. URMO17WK12:I11 TaxID=1283291 RepID=UPI00071EE3D7|nr:hypothetical protein [Pseudomonas sp. URMO17WK12:I11]CRL47078.1 hypothetical protein PSHI_00980 [Pseudomonas sp. URMO17WK12:I11]
MSNQLASDLVESIQLNGNDLDIANPKLELRCGQRYKLKLVGRKDAPSFTGSFALVGADGQDPSDIEIISSPSSGPESKVMELTLMTGNSVGDNNLEMKMEGGEVALTLPVNVSVGRIRSCRVRLANGSERAAAYGGSLISVPSDEGDVTLIVEHDQLDGWLLLGQGGFISFVPDMIYFNPHEAVFKFERDYNRRQIGWFLKDGVELRDNLFFEVNPSWAAFSSDGVDHGKFIPIMMEKHKEYKVSVRPLDPEENGTMGKFYGIPEWMDVYPDQASESYNDKPETMLIGNYVIQEIGGLGKSERYIRLKGSAPRGVIPVFFKFTDGKKTGGIVNVEAV